MLDFNTNGLDPNTHEGVQPVLGLKFELLWDERDLQILIAGKRKYILNEYEGLMNEFLHLRQNLNIPEFGEPDFKKYSSFVRKLYDMWIVNSPCIDLLTRHEDENDKNLNNPLLYLDWIIWELNEDLDWKRAEEFFLNELCPPNDLENIDKFSNNNFIIDSEWNFYNLDASRPNDRWVYYPNSPNGSIKIYSIDEASGYNGIEDLCSCPVTELFDDKFKKEMKEEMLHITKSFRNILTIQTVKNNKDLVQYILNQ